MPERSLLLFTRPAAAGRGESPLIGVGLCADAAASLRAGLLADLVALAERLTEAQSGDCPATGAARATITLPAPEAARCAS